VCNLAQAIVEGKRDSPKIRLFKVIAPRKMIQERREYQAFKTLYRGIDLAIDELWEKHFAQLEVRQTLQNGAFNGK
jgi:hypothetical protein